MKKWTFLLLGRRTSSGSMFLLLSFLACLSEAGKNIASDLDLIVSDPRCMIRPK